MHTTPVTTPPSFETFRCLKVCLCDAQLQYLHIRNFRENLISFTALVSQHSHTDTRLSLLRQLTDSGRLLIPAGRPAVLTSSTDRHSGGTERAACLEYLSVIISTNSGIYAYMLASEGSLTGLTGGYLTGRCRTSRNYTFLCENIV